MEVGYTEVEVPAVAPRYAKPPHSAGRLHVSDRQNSSIYLRDSFYLNLCSQSRFDKSRMVPSRKAQPKGPAGRSDECPRRWKALRLQPKNRMQQAITLRKKRLPFARISFTCSVAACRGMSLRIGCKRSASYSGKMASRAARQR